MKKRFYIFVLLVLGGIGAVEAFSSEEWLAQRDNDTEPDRLRAAYADCAKKVVEPAQNVTIPLEVRSDGTVKSRLRAGKAMVFLNTPYVWAETICVEQYADDGKTVLTRLTADSCVVDRNAKAGWIEGLARLDHANTIIKGYGVYVSFPREYVKIFARAEVRSSGLKFNPRSILK